MIYQFEADDTDYIDVALEVSIDALISETETSSCEWCDGEEHCISKARWTRLLMRGKTITASGDENASVEINYCPNCGRKLN